MVDESKNAESQRSPLVTVVIPVRNEARTIDGTLQSVVAQTYARLEILVVDGRSTDGTRQRIEQWRICDSRIQLLDNPDRMIPHALNVALERASGRWLARVDGHSTIPVDYVERLVAVLEQGGWAGAGGRKSAVGGAPSGDVIAAVLNSPAGVGGSVYHYATKARIVDHVPFGAYDTALARQVHGWDTRLVANEDFEFDVRMRRNGGRLYLDPTVVVMWQCRSRIRDLFFQYLRYGRGKADVALLHPSEVRLRHVAPPALVGAVSAALLASPLSLRPLALLGGGYATGLAALSIPIARTLSGRRAVWKIPAVLSAMHFGWGIGFLSGALRLLRHGLEVPSFDGSGRWDSPAWQPGTHPPGRSAQPPGE